MNKTENHFELSTIFEKMVRTAEPEHSNSENIALALIALQYINRRENLKVEINEKDPIKFFNNLSRQVEAWVKLEQESSIINIIPDISKFPKETLSAWLNLLSLDWPLSGFQDWFSDRLDYLSLSGRHYTPRSVSRLVASVLLPAEGKVIIDPACGSGSMLAAMAQFGNHSALLGNEVNIEARAWAQLNLTVQNIKNVKITDLKFPRIGDITPPKVDKFDIIMSNPPFGDSALTDYHQFDYFKKNSIKNLRGRISSEIAYLNWTIESLSENGTAAVIVPNGLLSRGGADRKIREILIQKDALIAVIGLPEKLFAPSTNIETALLIVGTKKAAPQVGKTLFVDARKFGEKVGSRTVMTKTAVDLISEISKEWRKLSGIADIATSGKIITEGYSFSPSRYIEEEQQASSTDAGLELHAKIGNLERRRSVLIEEYERLVEGIII